MENVTDEDIIRRKLIIEGDSGNDDKRIVVLLKTMSRFAQLDPKSEKRNDMYNTLICILQQCKHAMIHNLFVYQANNDQQQYYESLNNQINNKIELAQKKIESCQINLENAKNTRKNRMEYNNLAKIILQHPSREDSIKKLNEINTKLASLHKENENNDRKIDMRRKQFRLFLVALKDLKSNLGETSKSSKSESGDSNKMDLS